MTYRKAIACSLLLVCSLVAAGKNKKKILLPNDVLDAKTVLVVIDPDAGMSVDDPNANNRARGDVENALSNWGRFMLVTDVSTADLVITVRRGSGKYAQTTIGGMPNNDRPVIFQPDDAGGQVGGRNGYPPQAGDPTAPQLPRPHPQVEAGPSEDMFVVYRGKRDNALDSPPVWRYTAKDALQSPTVPAVDEFRKLIVEAEKQRAASQ